MDEGYKIIVTDADEDINSETLKKLIDEALNKTETIEEVLKEKEEELKYLKGLYKELSNDFKRTREIIKELIIRLKFSSIALRIEQSGSILFGLDIDPNEFDMIINDMKQNVKELRNDLRFLSTLEKAFRKLSKYNTVEKIIQNLQIRYFLHILKYKM